MCQTIHLKVNKSQNAKPCMSIESNMSLRYTEEMIEPVTNQYLHFQSQPLINLKIFATVYNLMKDINIIDSCQAHLPVQYALINKFISQK